MLQISSQQFYLMVHGSNNEVVCSYDRGLYELSVPYRTLAKNSNPNQMVITIQAEKDAEGMVNITSIVAIDSTGNIEDVDMIPGADDLMSDVIRQLDEERAEEAV